MKALRLLASFVLMFTLSVGVAFGAPTDKFVVPDQKIQGIELPIPLGELVDITVSPLKQPPQYLVASSYKWKVVEPTWDDKGKAWKFIDKHVRDVDGGVFFGSGIQPKKLLVTCVCTYLYVVKDGDKVTDVATRTVVLTGEINIGGSVPGPTPPPGPNPGPAPSFPDGQYKLSALAWSKANELVTDQNARTQGAKSYAVSLRLIVADIKSGKQTNLQKCLEDTATANAMALKAAGVSPDAWDAFGTAVQKYVYDLYKNKKLNTVADLGVAWEELAAGLEQVK